ncbi:hypothetical protein EVAR_90659_1 [Eumeta japonica]|uniref:Uncharacterized protein n=1 Tax=Eumeta variegata TaxID=151549 RepID=A0A4C1Z9V6_EUMVA|nr:hypothetical protein EVAR_90659_1 [Eumeta japonica]
MHLMVVTSRQVGERIKQIDLYRSLVRPVFKVDPEQHGRKKGPVRVELAHKGSVPPYNIKHYILSKNSQGKREEILRLNKKKGDKSGLEFIREKREFTDVDLVVTDSRTLTSWRTCRLENFWAGPCGGLPSF